MHLGQGLASRDRSWPLGLVNTFNTVGAPSVLHKGDSRDGIGSGLSNSAAVRLALLLAVLFRL